MSTLFSSIFTSVLAIISFSAAFLHHMLMIVLLLSFAVAFSRKIYALSFFVREENSAYQLTWRGSWADECKESPVLYKIAEDRAKDYTLNDVYEN